jgi:adenylyltransferase/sulfurtransferase
MKSNTLSPAEVTRYSLQIAMDGWGRESQERLKASRVLISGAGGVAAAVALHLLSTGVGALRVVDASRVALPDLNTTVLYRERDLGKTKATIAERRLKELNPFALVEGQGKTISEHNVYRLSAGCNLLIDAMNRPPGGHLLNLAAVRHRLPLIHVWVGEMDGVVTTCWPGQGPCLACVLPDGAPERKSALMGPIPGVMGALVAFEALRILGAQGPGLVGRLLIFQGERFAFVDKPLKPTPDCPVCSRGKA